MFSNLLESDIFKSFLKDIEPLGFKVSHSLSPGAQPYAVIGGRSNTRWWLIPLANHQITVSGLALFQPIIASACLLKKSAIASSGMGLTSLWARHKVYISGDTCLADIFRTKNLCYAFFTGTNSPHRKAAIQIMDLNGTIKGFAKVSCRPAVKPLLSNEAKILDYLQTLDLKSALIPKVIFYGAIGNTDLLVTDTCKTAQTKTATIINDHHRAFLHELMAKTATPVYSNVTDHFIKRLYTRYAAIKGNITKEWQNRLEETLGYLAIHDGNLRSVSMSHGDFTPWNTFFTGSKLYVFDWEYAQQESSPGYDLIHFLLSIPATKKKPVGKVISQVCEELKNIAFAKIHHCAESLLLIYLCNNSLHYINRELETTSAVHTWDGEQEQATLIDSLFMHQ